MAILTSDALIINQNAQHSLQQKLYYMTFKDQSCIEWIKKKKRNFLKVEKSITGKSLCSSHSWLKCQLENLVFPWTSLHSVTQMWITYAYIDWSLSQEGVGWFWAFSYNLASAWFLALHSKFSSVMINTCFY